MEYTMREYTLGANTYHVRHVASPGAFEGEPIFAQHFDAATSYTDASVYDSASGTTVADCFRAPFNLDTLPECETLDTLTDSEQACMEAAAGAILILSSSGFRSVTLYASSDEYNAAYKALSDEYERDDDGDDNP